MMKANAMRKTSMTAALALVAALAMSWSFLAPSAWADEAVGDSGADSTPELPVTAPSGMVSVGGLLQPMADTTLTEGDYNYTVNDDGQVTITKYTGTAESVSVPKNIAGLPVVSIQGAFNGSSTLKSVTVPDGVATIGQSAFASCKNLSAVTLPDSVTEIGGSAFANCPKLAPALRLPARLKKLGWQAYADDPVESVWVPKSLEEAGRPFAGCERLAKAEWEAGTEKVLNSLFEACPGLTSVTVPDGVATIGQSAFASCKNLSAVTLPDSVTEIGGSAFANCPKLAPALRLPARLKKLGWQAYADDPVESVWVPKSLEEAGRPFAGCERLAKAEWEAGTEKVLNSLFEACPGLTSVTVPDGVATIGQSAFASCKNLASVTFPQELSTIEGSAFANCPSLTSVTLPYLLKTLGWAAFSNCANLTDVYAGKKIQQASANSFDSSHTVIHTSKFSDSARTLIDADQQVLFTDSEYQDTNEKLVKLSQSSYEINDAAGSEYLQLKLHYELKPAKAAQATNQKLSIKLPKSSILYEIRKDGKTVPLADYSVTNSTNVVSFSVSGTSGDYSIYTTPDQYGRMNSYAMLSYTRNNQNCTELIGAVGADCSILTIGTSEEANFEPGVSSVPIRVRGFGLTGKNVEIFVDGKLATEATVSNAGLYNAQLSLSQPLDGKEYEVTARSLNTKGTEVEAKTVVTTVEGGPQLTAFSLYIEAHDYEHGHAEFDLLDEDGLINYITYQAGKPYRFTAKYTHREKIKKVFVNSLRGGEVAKLEAVWDEGEQAYVTHGYFNNNSAYVPGMISVEYTTYPEPSDMSKGTEINLTTREKNSIPSEWKNSTAELIEEEGTDFAAKITLESGAAVTYSFQNMTFAEYADQLGARLASSGSAGSSEQWTDPDKDRIERTQTLIKLLDAYDVTGERGFGMFKDIADILLDEDFRYYYTGEGNLKKDVIGLIKTEWSADKIIMYVIDPDKNDNHVAKYVIGKAEGAAEKTMYDMFGMSPAVGSYAFSMGKEMFQFEGQTLNYAQAYFDIMSNPNLSEADRQAKLRELQDMKEVACEKLVMTFLASTLKMLAANEAAGIALGLGSGGVAIAFGVLAVVVDKVIIPMLESGDLQKFVQGKLSLRSLLMRWIIDPSGFVYEGVTSNRVNGAKATVYYRESEADTTAKLWNAAEFTQENPLITDDGGNYAWNVPEGLWQVRVSKDGYETATTDWLPVPPPQTDVNIKLSNLANPTVETAYATQGSVRVSFSQYMDPKTVSSLKLTDASGKDMPYRLVYDQGETDADGNVYAKNYLLHLTGVRPAEGSAVTLGSISAAKSSTGVAATGADQKLAVGKDVRLTNKESISLTPGTTYDITLKLAGYANQKITVTSDAPGIVSVASVGSVNSSGTATVKLNGNVLGSATLTVAIEGTGIERKIPVKVADEISEGADFNDDPAPADISSCTVELDESSFKYDGTAKTPAVTVKKGDVTLEADKDYAVSYKDNVEAGKATVEVVGIDGYAGSVSKEFTIEAADPAIIPGDVTGDGVVAMNDILKINSYLLKRIQLTDAELAAADVTGDGYVAMNDILKINSYLLKRIQTLQVAKMAI